MSSNSVSRWCTPYPPLKTARLRTMLTLSTVTVQSQCLNCVLLIHLQRLHTVLTLSTVTAQLQCLMVYSLSTSKDYTQCSPCNNDTSSVTVSQQCTLYPPLKTTHSAHPVNSDSPVTASQCTLYPPLKTTHSAHLVINVNSDSPVRVSQQCIPYPPLKTMHSAHLVNSECPVRVSQQCTLYPPLKTTHSAHLVNSECPVIVSQ